MRKARSNSESQQIQQGVHTVGAHTLAPRTQLAAGSRPGTLKRAATPWRQAFLPAVAGGIPAARPQERNPCHDLASTFRSPGWKPGDTAAKDGCRYGGSVQGGLPKFQSAAWDKPRSVLGSILLGHAPRTLLSERRIHPAPFESITAIFSSRRPALQSSSSSRP
jgi:hypothetical protein